MRDAGAKVLVADCPEIRECNGIDDVLGVWERSDGADKAVEKCLDLLAGAQKFKEEKVSQADKLLRIADGIEVFHTLANEPFATIEVDGHLEHHRINSPAFKQRLAFEFYNENGKAPSTQAVQDAVQAISGKAIYEGPEGNVNIRVATFEGSIFVDLCNATWQIIEIGKNGWKIVEAANAPVKFRRTKAMTSLPTPSIAGDLQKLAAFLNVTARNLILILGWLINCFRPDYPFPILLLSGEQGTAKSTTSRVLRDLIDPCITSFRSGPRNEQDLIISASNSWIVGLDNLSYIQDWLSDALCRLSTGGGFATRKLYTDDEETILNAKRPIIINGIGDLASRSDLLDRALIVRLEPIPKEKRKTESSFWSDFEREKPAILSALLSAVSCGLRNLDTITIDGLPRMADFAHWVTACERGLGLNENAFLNIYDENQRDVHAVVLEDSILAEVIQEFCEKNAINDECDVSDVLLKDFLVQLKEAAGDKRSNDKRFPKSSRGLRSGLERINPNLREIGIHVTFHGKSGPNANKGASLSLIYRGKQTSPPSPTIQNELKTADLGGESIHGSTRAYFDGVDGVGDGPRGHNLTIVTIPQVHHQGILPENDGSDVCDAAATSFSVRDIESKVEDLSTEKRY
jgi:hypothetical protein